MLSFFRVTTHYIEGLAWVLHYYYQGVRLFYSWSHGALTVLLDTVLAMVLPIPFRTLRVRLRRRDKHGHQVHTWSALQAVRTTYGRVPTCEVGSIYCLSKKRYD